MSNFYTLLIVVGLPLFILFLLELSEQRHERRTYERYLYEEFHRKGKGKKRKHHD
jgi:hypothetical protein